MGHFGDMEQSKQDEAHHLALVMFNTFRMDIEKRDLALIDLSESLFRLAFSLQSVSPEDAAERLERMIQFARQVRTIDRAA